MRATGATRLYRDGHQGPTRTVAAFAAHMEELKEQMLLSDDVTRMHFLLDGLRPDIKRTVFESARMPEFREDLIALATRIPETRKATGSSTYRGRSQRGRGSGRESTPRDPQRHARDTGMANPSGGAPADKPRKFEGDCFNCGKKGHKAANCRSAARSTAGEPTLTPKGELSRYSLRTTGSER